MPPRARSASSTRAPRGAGRGVPGRPPSTAGPPEATGTRAPPVGRDDDAHLAHLEHAHGDEIGRAHVLGDRAVLWAASRSLRAAPPAPRAAGEHGDAGGQREGLGLVLRGVEGCGADLLLEPRPGRGASRAQDARRGQPSGLVEEEESRLHDERPGEGDPARRPPESWWGRRALRAGRDRPGRGPPRPCARRPTSGSPPRQAEGDVLAHRQVGPERVLPEDQPDATPRRRHVVDGLIVHQDAAGIQRRKPGEHGRSVVVPHPDGPSSV